MKAKNIDAPSKKPMQDWNEIAAELDKGDFMSFNNDDPSRFTTWVDPLGFRTPRIRLGVMKVS